MRNSAFILAIGPLLVVTAACRSEPPAADGDDASTPPVEPPRIEATSLLGEPLPALSLPDDFRAKQEKLLAEARAGLEARPGDPDALIWVGRRTAYLGRYGQAIEIYTRGIEAHPGDARFLRHRGHRRITLRRLDAAIADLERATELIAGGPDEIEPDGLPNPRNIPTSTLHSNIWYHLGLAHYLAGNFESARRAYRECMKFSNNPDMLCATSHWLYMTLRRRGEVEQAREVLEPIHAGMDIIENMDYHRLLLMYKGEQTAERLFAEAAEQQGSIGFATVGYGVGNWYLYNGDRERALSIFARVVESGSWAAFGFIAAEAELARAAEPGP